MNNLLNIMSTLSNQINKQNSDSSLNNTSIPQEVLSQYPYGEFPIRYTKLGQEQIRKHSENRFSDVEEKIPQPQKQQSPLDFNSLLPFIQMLSTKNTSQKDMLNVFSELLFKDNQEIQSLLKLFTKQSNKEIKSQSIDNTSTFPNTNKVNINNLKKINT